ncbi:MAG: PLP-dependent aminotransferase family protein [Lachnospiraceae bacterium]|nr:PLP-dependent aminotransferase family protein [Lachnospiraceae bacterium]
MKNYIDPHIPKVAYLQLYEHLRQDIMDGVFAYGTKLPSKRLLAEETGVSVITVEHAYAILADEGYIEARPRSGYFAIYRAGDFLSGGEHFPAAKQSAASSGTMISSGIPTSTGNSVDTPFPFSVLARTMRKVLTDYGQEILSPSPNHGCPQLRGAIASYLARSHGIQVQAEQIIIGSGAEYLYTLIAQLLGQGHIFALEDPSYAKIQRVYEASGVQCDPLALGSDGILTSELERTQATILHVTPFNSYPSGITASASKRREYLLWASRRSGYIIEDNYDSELTVSRKKEDPLFSLAGANRVLYLNTFSRTIAPSIRVGYMLLPQSLMDPFEERLGFYSCTVPLFEQYVLAELLNSGDFERHINRVRRARRKAGK